MTHSLCNGPSQPAWRVLAIYALIISIGSLSIDMYLPAIPAIRRELATGTAPMQTTMAVYLLGLAIGQLAYGPLSDAFGRKRPLLLGMAIYVLAAACCALAGSVEALIGFRLLQALGASASTVTIRAMIRAMIRDRHAPADVARALSLLTAVMGVAPIVAPLIGSAILDLAGWRAIFVCLAAFAGVMGITATLALQETHPGAPGRISATATWRGMGRLLRHGRFVRLAFAGAATQSGLFAYLSSAPVVFADGFGLESDAIGRLFAVSGAAYIAGAHLNRLLLRRCSPTALMQAGMRLHLVAAVLMLVFGATGQTGLHWLMVAVCALMVATGMVSPNAIALALAPFKGRAGMAASLMGALQYALAGVTSLALGVVGTGSVIPLALTLVAIGLFSQLLWRGVLPRKE